MIENNTLPPIHRIGYSGLELDTILLSAKNKLDKYRIAVDWLGGIDRMAAAELAKILREGIDVFYDPEKLKQLLESIPNVSFFTTEMKDKILNSSSDFKGVYLSRNQRNQAIDIDYLTYTGGELTLILDDGEGLAKFDEWDYPNQEWVELNLYDFDRTFKKTSDGTPIRMMSFNMREYHFLKIATVVFWKDLSNQTHIESIERNITVFPSEATEGEKDYKFNDVAQFPLDSGPLNIEMTFDTTGEPIGSQRVWVNVKAPIDAEIRTKIAYFVGVDPNYDYTSINFDGGRTTIVPPKTYVDNVADGGKVFETNGSAKADGSWIANGSLIANGIMKG